MIPAITSAIAPITTAIACETSPVCGNFIPFLAFKLFVVPLDLVLDEMD